MFVCLTSLAQRASKNETNNTINNFSDGVRDCSISDGVRDCSISVKSCQVTLKGCQPKRAIPSDRAVIGSPTPTRSMTSHEPKCTPESDYCRVIASVIHGLRARIFSQSATRTYAHIAAWHVQIANS